MHALGRVLNGLARSGLRSAFAVRGAWCFQLWFSQMSRQSTGIDLVALLPPPDTACLVRRALTGLKSSDLDMEESAVRVVGDGWTRRTIADVRVRHGDKWTPVRVSVAHNVGQARHVEWLRAPALGGADHAFPCLTKDWLVAEKAALLVTYGPDHSRFQDIFDIWILQQAAAFEASVLAEVMREVFQGRDAERMLLRSDGYWKAALDRRRPARQQLVAWERLAARAAQGILIPGLPQVLADVGDLLLPVLGQFRDQGRSVGYWHRGTGWAAPSEAGGATEPRQPSLLPSPSSPRAPHCGSRRSRTLRKGMDQGRWGLSRMIVDHRNETGNLAKRSLQIPDRMGEGAP
ncbi:nucleotidyl transferase AbiEii/AbiGii toxin family protein [Pseudoroseomonas cervicalis]|uniref:nucleotidyl transferase AbiEii/AbiGii toxin family protein n=1 Tax=Teichococcus cervicalis TaxID=204525 RepID=UPI0022F1B657|nr:nucleotidyl transferase AbiEii/AbiGii toxin family protein [Pseudoroseomonas cervicalis]WBV44702.1 nucleotidyl transferase AbiEii/AbiGii toxin family protein [Pseudoroseomonas cervicalis]